MHTRLHWFTLPVSLPVCRPVAFSVCSRQVICVTSQKGVWMTLLSGGCRKHHNKIWSFPWILTDLDLTLKVSNIKTRWFTVAASQSVIYDGVKGASGALLLPHRQLLTADLGFDSTTCQFTQNQCNSNKGRINTARPHLVPISSENKTSCHYTLSCAFVKLYRMCLLYISRP